MLYCAVLGCKHDSAHPPMRQIMLRQGITLHRFPSDLYERSAWIAATGRKKWKPSKVSRMCSAHFESSYIQKSEKKVVLDRFALPTICIHTPAPTRTTIHIDGQSMPRDKPKPATTSSAEGKCKSFVGAPDGKVEYKCPKCEVSPFSVYHSALKHIQKTHCTNSDGEVEDVGALKPILMKLCVRCNAKVRPDDHQCVTDQNVGKKPYVYEYVCAGCEQAFATMAAYDVHLPGSHGDCVETMLFATMEEFSNWKQDMMSQTKCSYTLMGTFLAKQLYRCSDFVNDISGSTVHLCPSTVMCQTLTEGTIQVHFYKRHCGHDCTDYALTDKYKSCSIINFLQRSEPTNGKLKDSDLQSQFMALMESVVLSVSKVDVRTLKALLGKAREMVSILNNFQGAVAGDDDEEPMDLETELPAKRSRRKSTLIERDRSLLLQTRPQKVQKRVTRRKKAQRVPYTYSLAINSKDSEKILMELDEKSVSKPNILRPKLGVDTNMTEANVKSNHSKDKRNVSDAKGPTSTTNVPISPIIGPKSILTQSPPSSFNDSYKDFVGKTLFKTAPQAKAKKARVKTKMGQFKPSTSPKNVENVKVASKNANVASKNANVASKNANVASKNANVASKNANVASKSSNVASKNANVASKNANVASKKAKVASKNSRIVNFPRRNTAIRSKRRKVGREDGSSVGSVKDVTYEVMERENDCNILILKL